MATASIHPQRTRVTHTDSATAAPKSKKRHHWRLLIGLAGLAAVVWLLPAIVVHTPLFHWILGKATADLNGSVSVQSASLGWLSPVAVEGVEVKDAQGKSVLTLPAVSGDRSLAALLCNYTNLGTFTLERPKVSIVLRDDGSNVEDLLAKYLAPKEQPSSPVKIGLVLEIVDGSVSVTEQLTGLTCQVEKLGVTVDMSQGTDGPLAVKASAALSDARTPGKLSAGVKMAAEGNSATLSVEQISLAVLRPLAARFVPGTKLSGRLSTTIGASWGGTAGKNSVQADISTQGFSFSAPLLQGDVVALDRFHAAGQVSWQADRVDIEKAMLDCDLGTASLESTLQLGEKGGLSLGALLGQRHELRGQVDLARLARLLPKTLHLRQQMQINSGQAAVSFDSKPQPQDMAWDGQLDAVNLTATAAGRPITWERPLSLVLKAHETPAGPVIDALNCESDFAKLHANGTPDALAASMTFNLKLLADRLGQFVDLGSLQLAGEGTGNLNWRRSPQQQFDADASLQLTNLQVALPNQTPWREPDLLARLTAKGQTDLSAETRIDAAALNVKAGADQLDVQLAAPVKDLRNGGIWPLRVQTQGQLQNWPGRLAAWLPANSQLSGAYALEADVTAAKDRVDLRQVRLAVAPLIVASPWLNVNEPRRGRRGRRLVGPAATAAAHRAGQPGLRDGGRPGQQRRPGRAREGSDGIVRHAGLPGRRGPAGAMVQRSRQAAGMATGGTTPRLGAIAANGRRHPRRCHGRRGQSGGRRCGRPAVPGAHNPPGGARRLQQPDEHTPTRAIGYHLRCGDRQGRRPHGAGRRRQRRPTQRPGSATTWNASAGCCGRGSAAASVSPGAARRRPRIVDRSR